MLAGASDQAATRAGASDQNTTAMHAYRMYNKFLFPSRRTCATTITARGRMRPLFPLLPIEREIRSVGV